MLYNHILLLMLIGISCTTAMGNGLFVSYGSLPYAESGPDDTQEKAINSQRRRPYVNWEYE